MGIRGNEIADAGAREATENGTPENIPILLQDIKTLIDVKVNKNWQMEWNHSDSKLRAVKLTVNKWISPLKLSKREQVALCRLRLGHTYLSFAHLLQGIDPPVCENCGVRLTVKHILLNCLTYSDVRARLNMSDSFHEILSNDLKLVEKNSKFLHYLNLLRKI